jgi:tRNA (guanosine-2'-O-)-methyltransferase
MNIFLYGPDDFKNLCVISRSFECFGVKECFVYDPHHLIRNRYGKSYSNRIRTVSAGAFFKVHWEIIKNPLEFIRSFSGRHICTTPSRDALSIYQYSHQQTDLIIFGSERKGIPDDIQRYCDLNITIPIIGTTQSLNLSISVSILVAKIYEKSKKAE